MSSDGGARASGGVFWFMCAGGGRMSSGRVCVIVCDGVRVSGGVCERETAVSST